MSTRGYVGYRLDKNRVALVYNQSDSYPRGLLKDIIENGADRSTFDEYAEMEEPEIVEMNLEELAKKPFFRLHEFSSQFYDRYVFIEYVYIIDEINNKIWCIENYLPNLQNEYYWRVFAVIDRDVMDKFYNLIDTLEDVLIKLEDKDPFYGWRELIEEVFGTIEITKDVIEKTDVKKALVSLMV